MFRLSVVGHIGRQLARFAAAEQGNIAVIFAIALVPVLSMVGAAVDYSRAVQARISPGTPRRLSGRKNSGSRYASSMRR